VPKLTPIGHLLAAVASLGKLRLKLRWRWLAIRFETWRWHRKQCQNLRRSPPADRASGV